MSSSSTSSSSSSSTTPAALLIPNVLYFHEATEQNDRILEFDAAEKYMIRPATKNPGVYTLVVKTTGPDVHPKTKKPIIVLVRYNISPVKGGAGKWQSVDKNGKKATYDSLTNLLIATGARKPDEDINVVGARFMRVALALAAAREHGDANDDGSNHIETTQPICGRHTPGWRLAEPLIGRAYTSHEPLAGADKSLDPTLVEGRVSRYDQNAHVWTQMLNAEHKDHALDVERQTRKSATAIIAAREQWSADWVVHYADAVNGEQLTAALCFGKHVPMPNDDDSPLSILNTYAS